MKVAFITEGGKNIGFGHITRCMTLYQTFEKKGLMPEFIVNGDETIKDLLKNQKHKMFNWLDQKNGLFKILNNADIVIIDSYLADLDFYKKVSKIAQIPVYIDDTKRLDYPSGIVVNGAICAEELNYPKRDDVIYLLGIKYIALRKKFWDVPQKEIKEKIRRIMITFGGDDARGITYKILSLINEYHPELNKKVIVGKGFKNIEKIEKLKDNKIELIYHPDAKDMKEAMLETDIAISAGGQTIYELARTGTPTVGVCVADNQLNNLECWSRCGFLEYCGWYDDLDLFGKLGSAIMSIQNKAVREKMKRAGQVFVDGRGAERTVDRIMEVLKGIK